ncbi:hypothetical protein BHU72_06420 [Desulfuribacillus stibiiarsenatis]|uniref:Uncharacterized protein n=2 Tax=Desulfuribacillus stibiiarsenatis TaxID=1390249 RepID=A0A1E5L538_9FIRM|nr:hypothetical protein BHU72_06420 [Desulfuribacillus stibiiarsenatis]
MGLRSDFWYGFLIGTVTGAVGYRLYEQNRGQLHSLIQPGYGQAMCVPASTHEASMEELVAQKERLEDMIAEKKIAQ